MANIRQASTTPVVVVPIGIAEYDPPSAELAAHGRSRFDSLERLEPELDSLLALFATDAYRERGFEIRQIITGSSTEINSSLQKIADELAVSAPSHMLLIWLGHAEVPSAVDGLRLAARNSLTPMGRADGLSPDHLVRFLLDNARAGLMGLVFDVCRAGAALPAIADSTMRSLGAMTQSPGMTAVVSAAAFETAVDGSFTSLFERVLRTGPSGQARARMDEMDWSLSANNALISLDEVCEVLKHEFACLPAATPQTPDNFTTGRRFRLFPNPCYRRGTPPRTSDEASRAWLRPEDLESHFLPKARGLEPGEPGWRFAGRVEASRKLVAWIAGPSTARAFVVSGGAGSGKSALIGRLVALNDAQFRQREPVAISGSAPGTLAPEGAIHAALNIRRLSVRGAAGILSELLGLPPLDGVEELADWLRKLSLLPETSREPKEPLVVLDGLDEADDPAAVVTELLAPLVELGWRFIIGSRPLGTRANLAEHLPCELAGCDLERLPSNEEDVQSYCVMALHDMPSASTFSEQERVALASAIASRSGGNFLFARLALSGLRLRSKAGESVDDATDSVGRTVGEAFRSLMDRLDQSYAEHSGTRGSAVRPALLALAWARGNGLPLHDGVWSAVSKALSPSAPKVDLKWVLREAGSFIVESGEDDQAVYRLFHEALNEHLRADERQQRSMHADSTIGHALRGQVRIPSEWALANAYTVRHLATHLRGDYASLKSVIADPWFLSRRLQLCGIDDLVSMLREIRRVNRGHTITLISDAVMRARVILAEQPEQLAAQIAARVPPLNALLRNLLGRLAAIAPRRWLRLRVAALATTAGLEVQKTLTGKVRALTFGRGAQAETLYIGVDRRVMAWNLITDTEPRLLYEHPYALVTALAFGNLRDRPVLVLAARSAGCIGLIDAESGRLLAERSLDTPIELAVGKLRGEPGLTNRELLVVVAQGGNHLVELQTLATLSSWPDSHFTLGRLHDQLVQLDLKKNAGALRNAGAAETLGPDFLVPSKTELAAIGWVGGLPLTALVVDRRKLLVTGPQVGKSRFVQGFTFPVRSLAIGEVAGECVVAASEDSDDEHGRIELRQPFATRTQNTKVWKSTGMRVSGVGVLEQRSQTVDPRPKIVLLSPARGAIDPVTGRLAAASPDDLVKVRVRHGDWSFPGTRSDPPKQTARGTALVLDPKFPFSWPDQCEACEYIDGRLLHARATYGGCVKLVDVESGDLIGWPLRSVPEKQTLRLPTPKQAPNPDIEPTSAIALAAWRGVGAVVAVAQAGRVRVTAAATGALLLSLPRGRSTVEAVALDQDHKDLLLATGAADGTIDVWSIRARELVASLRLDSSIRDLWMCEDTLCAHVVDGTFHIIDLCAGGALQFTA